MVKYSWYKVKRVIFFQLAWKRKNEVGSKSSDYSNGFSNIRHQ